MSAVFHRRVNGDKGFTLIELLVVIIIIAILAAIAIPTFLGQRQKAQDASAKSLVRNAITAMEAGYVDSHTYANSATVMGAVDPPIIWTLQSAHVATAGGSPAVTSTALASASTVDYFGDASTYSIASVSASGNKFGVYTNTGTGGGTSFVKVIGGTASNGW
jgi:type IV pilus assembly protein PilA